MPANASARSARAPSVSEREARESRPLQVCGSRRLYTLPSEETFERLALDAEHAPDADGVEAAVVDQPADRLRVDAQAARDVTDGIEGVFNRSHESHFEASSGPAHEPNGGLAEQCGANCLRELGD